MAVGTYSIAIVTALLIWLQLAAYRGQAEAGLSVVANAGGQYSISVNQKTWLRSAPTFCTVNKKTYTEGIDLHQISSISGSGRDKFGEYDYYEYGYKAGDSNIKTNIRYYRHNSTLIFTQIYPEGANDTSTDNEHGVIFGFPNVKVEALGLERGYFSYGGIFLGDIQKHLGRWDDSTTFIKYGLDGGPLGIFDKNKSVIFMSPFDNFMAANNFHDRISGGSVSWGIMGKVNKIPKGFTYSTILHYDNKGYNKALESWGKIMRRWYNKKLNNMNSDVIVNYLGYWTDNGAYYYYNTEPNKTYEDTIIDVKANADKLGLPYRYIQYDSWWYPQGLFKGVIEWTAKRQVFPHGLRYLYEKHKLPVIAHNRWWSFKTTYAKQNGGKYNFVVDGFKAMPDDQTFWDHLLSEAKQWGLISYEQDWLNVEFNGMQTAISDLDLGRRWLTQMGNAATKNNMTIQYCMAQVRDGLQSLEIPAVTQIRVSEDYSPGWEQWRIGISSILAYALGLAPYKDTFWSTVTQPGNPYGREEKYPALNAVVSTLSTGPVGPGDMIGGTNASLVMMSCNAEGLILKPSKPATALDAQLLELAFQDGSGPAGEVWSTYTSVGVEPGVEDVFRFGIVFAASMANTYEVHQQDLDLHRGRYRVYYLNGPPSEENIHILPEALEDAPIKLTPSCTKTDFCLYYITPAFYMMDKEIVVFGELDKWVHISAQRVKAMSGRNYTFNIQLTGVPGEQFKFWYMLDGAIKHFDVTLDDKGQGHVTIVVI